MILDDLEKCDKHYFHPRIKQPPKGPTLTKINKKYFSCILHEFFILRLDQILPTMVHDNYELRLATIDFEPNIREQTWHVSSR